MCWLSPKQGCSSAVSDHVHHFWNTENVVDPKAQLLTECVGNLTEGYHLFEVDPFAGW